jgi:hypothetical protein
MMNVFKQIFKKAEPKLLDTPRKTVNYESAIEIGVLFSSAGEDNHKAINYFVKLLQKDRKQVRVLAFFEEKHSNPYDFRFDFFTNTDVDFKKGTVSSVQVEDFMQKKFDYLYCINSQPFEPFHYILRKSQASLRVGKLEPESLDCFELMVDIPENASTVDLILQMLHYTKSLIINN